MADSADMLGRLEQERSVIRDARDGAPDAFPVEPIERLRALGLLTAPLPAHDGGLGWGTERDGMRPLGAALQMIGHSSLAVGRIYEAHVNAIALIDRYGDVAVRESAWSSVRDGLLFGLWVSPSATPVRLTRDGTELRILGLKGFCSAAGVAARAVVTTLDEGGCDQMVLVDATRVDTQVGNQPGLHGMRNTATRPVAFDMPIRALDLIGGPDDYLREPDFSAGAWRTSAVTAGGLRSLVEETIGRLRGRGRHRDPHQSARIGQMLIRCKAAAMWADAMAEQAALAPADLAAFVGLGRIAIEQACLEVIPLVQRGLGLSAFVESNPVERMMRDLATYLRQPAGDDVLSESAICFAESAAR
jgi:alkylation response protein AidB-like acyl-CoA dehydrogenase